MNIPNMLSILTLAIIIYLGYRIFSRIRMAKAPSQDPASIFKLSLDKLKKAGLTINPGVQEADIFDRWTEVLAFYSNPVEALYITLGDRTEYDPFTDFSNSCWHFDLEAIEGEGSYVRILENLARISNGDLDFQNITDYCNDDEDGKAWVSFEFNGDKYKWDLKVDNDWADGHLFDKIQDLCKKYNKKGRLTYFSEGQSFVTSYLTEEEFNKINKITGLKLEWLTAGNGQIY
jgi:hypothetical protein